MKITAEAHDRLWTDYQRVLAELAQAKHTISALVKGPLETTAVISPDPLEPKKAIGIVQCPKCGQMMEVEA
jgi:hypothetical protein